jgi:hypothetical protein
LLCVEERLLRKSLLEGKKDGEDYEKAADTWATHKIMSIAFSISPV